MKVTIYANIEEEKVLNMYETESNTFVVEVNYKYYPTGRKMTLAWREFVTREEAGKMFNKLAAGAWRDNRGG